MTNFLPVTMQELLETGVSQPDFVYITGDAYVDHPSFGAAIITRLLQSQGYSVAVLAQPDWHTVKDFTRFGKPRLAFLVTGGNIDSMVAHYTSAKRKRSTDMYSPGGRAGLRPDRAVITYCRKIREAYPDAAIAIGGLEASLRRFAHYDYWDDTVRPSILADSGADLLMYGMGEHQITELAQLLAEGVPIQEITDIRGTCYLTSPENTPWGGVQCPDYAQVCRDKKAYAKATRQQYDQQDEITGKTVLQRHGEKMLVQNPPAVSLTQEELDAVYRLPYQRKPHPMYDAQGGVPGIEEVQFSIAHNRGCFGYCNFCCIRAAASPAAARSPFWKKRKRSRKCPTSRAISMMSAARRQTSGCPPVKSRRDPACASGKSVLLRNPARRCRWITASISAFSGSCGNSPR